MGIRIRIGRVELRQLSRGEIRELYRIRNHESVRRFMSKPGPITFRSHKAFVEQHILTDPNFQLLLVRPGPGRRAVGLCQLRRNGQTAEIGVMFREPALHQALTGVSTVATLHLAFEHLRLATLTSYVLSTHAVAIAFNKYFGATEETADVPGMTKLRLTREQCLQNGPFRRVWRRIEPRFQLTDEPGP